MNEAINNVVVPAGDAPRVGGLYVLAADGTAARQAAESTCLVSAGIGAPGDGAAIAAQAPPVADKPKAVKAVKE